MADQERPLLDIGGEIFCAASERNDFPARQALDEVRRKRKAQVGPPLLDGQDARTFHDRLEPSANCLDLWQLRHIRRSSCGRTYRAARLANRDVRRWFRRYPHRYGAG